MAADSPHNTHNTQGERKWDRYLKDKSSLPQLKAAEHAKDFKQFKEAVERFDHEINQDTLWKYWQEVDPSKSDTPQHTPSEHATPHGNEHATGGHGEHKSFSEKLQEGLVPGVANLLKKPKFMEEDKQFWKIVEQEQKAWAKENKKPGWRASKEEKTAYVEKWTDFYYGSLDAEGSTKEGKSLEERSKDKLKEQYESDTKENGKKKSQNEIERDKKKLAQYEENEKKTTEKVGLFRKRDVPIKFDNDHHVNKVKQNIQAEAGARYALLKKKGLKSDELDQSYKAIMKRLEEKHWKAFAQQHPEKAAHFAKEDYKIKTFKKRWWEKKNTRQEYEDQKKASFEAFHNGREQFLREQEAALKEKEQAAVIDRGKVHTDKDALTPQQAADRLQALSAQATGQTSPTQITPQIILPPSATQTTPPSPTPPPATTVLSPSSPQPSPSDTHPLPASSPATSHTGETSPHHPETPPHTPPSPNTSSETRLGKTARVLSVIRDPKAAMQQAAAAFAQRKIVNVRENMGNRVFGEKRFGKISGAFGKANTALKGITDPKAALQNWAQNKVQDMALQYGKKAVMQFFGRFVIFNPYFWAGVGIVLFILIVIGIIMAIIGGPFGNTSSSTQTIPGLTLRLEGPSQVANSENIQYTVHATYTGTADITLSDPLPSETTFVSATGNYQLSFGSGGKNTVTWKLNDNTPTTTASTKTYAFTLVLHPDKDDVLVKNKILATAVGVGGGGSTLPPNPNAGDFEAIMHGQGRNTGVLGDENSFTAKVMANEPRIVRYENLIRKAYQAAIARNVNPLVLITIWGEESGYDTSGRFFAMGCGVYIGIPKDFDSQLSCSVKTWDNLMKEYETKAQNGIPVRIPSQLGKECLYDDAFLYAAERYGPVCAAYDSNDHFHNNFYKFYKQLLGQ